MTKDTKRTVAYVSAGIVLMILTGIVSWELAYQTVQNQPALTNFWLGIQATGAFLTAVAIVLGFVQVRQTKKQLHDNRTWNKMSFALTYLPSFDMFFEWEKRLDETLIKLIQRTEPLQPEEVRALFLEENSATHQLLKAYLNALEAYCLAVNCGLASEEVAEKIWGYKLVRHYKELLPYITTARHKAQNDEIFIELERLCKKWAAGISTPNPQYGE